MKKMIIVFSILIPVLIVFSFIVWIVADLITLDNITQLEGNSNYGKIIGNYDNKRPEEFIFSFFPQNIDSSFSDVSYQYTAKKGDTYGYSCYLEFVIEDPNKFSAFISQFVSEETATIFPYDDQFMDYTISNIFDIEWSPQKNSYSIGYARIGKILYSPTQQRVIFFALGVYDGGGTYVSELNTFFDRFQIDIEHYRQNAFYCGDDQKEGVLFKDRFPTEIESGPGDGLREPG